MAITLKLEDGIQYDGFTSITVFKSMHALSGAFEFEATSRYPESFPIKQGQECVVYVNNQKVVSGYIESITRTINAHSHIITIKGRDKTADILDSSIYKNIEVLRSIKLEDLIRLILKKNNITGIEVINNVSNLKIFNKSDKISASLGMNVFDMIQKYCKKRQVLCSTNGDGNIVLQRAGTKQIANYLLNELSNTTNNILSVSLSENTSNSFNKIVVISPHNSNTSVNKNKSVEDITTFSTNKNIRTSRITVVLTDSGLNKTQAKDLADWYINIKRARQIGLSLNIQGFGYDSNDDTKIWEPNQLINIKDTLLNIDASMLIKSVKYNFSNDGSITELELTNRDAYNVVAVEPEIYSKHYNVG